MDCKEVEKMIPDFIEQGLSYKKLRQFLKHVDMCKGCREELTIQFLVTEGMIRLEQGSAFDLQKELDARLEEAAHEIQRHRTIKYIGITLEAIAILAIGVILFLLLV